MMKPDDAAAASKPENDSSTPNKNTSGLKEMNGHDKQDGLDDVLAKNGRMDLDDGTAEKKQASQVVVVKEVARSMVQSTLEQFTSLGASKGGKDANSAKGLSVNTNSEQIISSHIMDVVMAEPVRKSGRARIPSIKYARDEYDNPIPSPNKPIPSPKSPALATHSKPPALTTHSESPAPALPTLSTPKSPAPKTPQELYNKIKKSRDKLFFIAYNHSKDPLISNEAKEGMKKGYQWYLVRVDLSTCQQLPDTKNCQKTGKYYVEFYTKSSYDQGKLMPGNPLENGVTAAKMKAKPDSDSRYWLEWHDYYFDKHGDMVVGKAKEFLPNSKKAIHRRLMDLSQRKRQGPSSPGTSEGEDRLMSEYHPNFDKYTTWADCLDLMDTKTRLVGPFDFDDIKPPPLKEEDLAIFNEETKKLFSVNHSNLFVKERVHLSRWQELTEALKGREIEPPTVPKEVRRKKKRVSVSKRAREMSMGQAVQPSGEKRAREESKGQAAQPIGEKRAREESKGQATQFFSDVRAQAEPKRPVCQDCGKGATEKEPLLLFLATSSRPSLHVHASCRKKKHDQTIASKGKIKQEIMSMVEATFTRTRQATPGDGKAYYVFGEVKEALNQALGSWMGGVEVEAQASSSSREGAKVATVLAKTSEPELLEGLPEADFTEEEIDLFPVAFSYNNEDSGGISEENAKIATLEYEVEQRRLKRSGPSKSSKRPSEVKNNDNTGTTPKSKSTPRKGPKFSPRKRHSTASEREVHIPTEPAEGFPAGWVARKIPRAGKGPKHIDIYYYSPKFQFKFRSKPAVRRFLEAMESSGGDEAVAIEKFKK
mmetsp:Transcript_13131/g.23802  ORF Transcript_13131/g.23802 Transcript_13131/m.23802 type:complete len:821 (-) Transcript_13131:80-2542(-)